MQPSDVDLSGVDVPESENSSITDTINSVLGEFGGASYLLHTGCGLSSMCPAEPGLAEVNYRTYDLFPEHFNEVLWFLEEFDYSYYDDEYYYDEYYDEEYYDAEYYDEEYYYDESTDDAAARKVASAGERRPTKRALKARQTKRALKTRNLRQDGEATPAPDVLVTVEAGCCTQSFCTSGVAQAALSLALAALSVAAVVLAL